jgi:eukaryotic translation initiation factor 2C
MVRERIKDWVLEQSKTTMPTNILYYRDGVSEGQYEQIQDYELPQIRDAYRMALTELKQEGWVPSGPVSESVKLTAIVVGKRHHVRFYPPAGGKEANENCLAGTSVQHVVTSPYFQDFYLQSHAAIKGTARPAHYFILVDDMEKDLEKYRQLVSLCLTSLTLAKAIQTNELCYTSVRATVPVSYASPAYYADRLCERGRCYLRDFFVITENGKPRRNEQKALKRQKESELKEKRVRVYGALRDPQTGQKRAKGEQEKSQEKLDRETAFEVAKKFAMDQAKEVFSQYKMNDPTWENPWHRNVSKTMFWM